MGIVNVFFRTIVLSMLNISFSLFSPYFRKFPPGPQFWNLSFLSKCVQKTSIWTWKLYPTHPTDIDSEYIILTSFRVQNAWISLRNLLLWWWLGLCIPFLLLHAKKPKVCIQRVYLFLKRVWYIITHYIFIYQKSRFHFVSSIVIPVI